MTTFRVPDEVHEKIPEVIRGALEPWRGAR
jgi:hypothetical protein